MIREIESAIDSYIESVQAFKELMHKSTGQINYYCGISDLEIKIYSKKNTEKEKLELKKVRKKLTSQEQLCKEKTLSTISLLKKYYALSEDEISVGERYVDIWKGFTYLNESGEIKDSKGLMQSIYSLIDKWNLENKNKLKFKKIEVEETNKPDQVLVKEVKKNIKETKPHIEERYYSVKEDGQLSLL